MTEHRPSITAGEDRAWVARVVRLKPLGGVAAGSALLLIDGRLLAVHDDSFRVTWIDPSDFALESWVLQGAGAALPKASKPDFEAALVTADGAVHLLGSGSTAQRCVIARLDLGRRAVTIRQNVPLYERVRDVLKLDTRPNIEGAIVVGEVLRVFHRGVGGGASAAVDLPLDVLFGAPPQVLALQWIELGMLDGVPLGLTDVAALDDERAVFVAGAEDTADAVSDGPIAGSVLGVLAAAAARARWTRLVDADGRPLRRKVEGLVIDADCRGGWILTDADDAAAPAELGRIEITGMRG